MNPELLTRTLQDFLGDATGAVVLENGVVAFDLAQAKYSISGERNRCLLHLWSAERNSVRRVLDVELKNGALRLAVQRLGQAHPGKLEICRERDRRTPTAKKAARSTYECRLRRAIESHFPGYAIPRLTTGVDLENSFGPIYARGVIRQGQSGFAVLGVNQQETQASIDASLSFGILWFDQCRESAAGKYLVEGLILFVPQARSGLVSERMANLNYAAAKWRLFEFEERDGALVEMDCCDRGNLRTRLVHAPNEAAALARFAECIGRIQTVLPNCEVVVLSSAEVSFRWRGLEFARARMGAEAETFRSRPEVVFGIGAEERVLDDGNWAWFTQLLKAVREARHVYGARHDRLFRLHPESWLESMLRADISVLDERLESVSVYTQVPAFSAGDRAMIDLLTATREGRIAVVELKADEDLHLPLQGLDYWARVHWHHERGEFLRYGYFSGWQLQPDSPLLFLVAPALHVHPATDVLLRYVSSEVDWTLVGIDERWREGVKVVFRKRPDLWRSRGPELLPRAS
jgi:hypothetical protein